MNHRVHRGIIVLKKERKPENTEKKRNKNSVLSVVKKIRGLRGVGSVCFYSFCFLIFDILFLETSLLTTCFNNNLLAPMNNLRSV